MKPSADSSLEQLDVDQIPQISTMANPNDQAKLKKRLEALVKLVDNQTCADCRKRGMEAI